MRKSADIHIFLLNLSQFQSSNGKEEHFEHKGVIEIIFNSEILAKFQSREDNRQWHHIIGLYSHYWLLAYPLVWAIVFTSDKAMREASL